MPGGPPRAGGKHVLGRCSRCLAQILSPCSFKAHWPNFNHQPLHFFARMFSLSIDVHPAWTGQSARELTSLPAIQLSIKAWQEMVYKYPTFLSLGKTALRCEIYTEFPKKDSAPVTHLQDGAPFTACLPVLSPSSPLPGFSSPPTQTNACPRVGFWANLP